MRRGVFCAGLGSSTPLYAFHQENFMPNYFYADANGQKQGPVDEQQLQELIDQGIINPNTRLVTDTGHKGLAGQIPGLKFISTAPSPATTFCTNCGTSVSEQAVACMSCGAKPVGHRKFCRQCGAGLNSEQVVCTTCGARVSGTTGKATPSVSQQCFCTNCGNPVSGQTVACMSCGAKPAGHRKFCRQCATALGPEQVVCVKCGASVTATLMPDAKQAAQTAISSLMGIFNNNLKWVIIIAVVLGLGILIYKFASNIFGGHPPIISSLVNAKSGDWVKYDVTISTDGNTAKGMVECRVLTKEGKKVKLRITSMPPGRYENARYGVDPTPEIQELEVDLSKPQTEIIRSIQQQLGIHGSMMRDVDVKVKRGAMGKGTMSVAGQIFNCVIAPYTVTVTNGNVAVSIRDIKEWGSKKVPVTGLVKLEWQTSAPIPSTMIGYGTGTFGIAMTLTEFGNSN